MWLTWNTNSDTSQVRKVLLFAMKIGKWDNILSAAAQYIRVCLWKANITEQVGPINWTKSYTLASASSGYHHMERAKLTATFTTCLCNHCFVMVLWSIFSALKHQKIIPEIESTWLQDILSEATHRCYLLEARKYVELGQSRLCVWLLINKIRYSLCYIVKRWGKSHLEVCLTLSSTRANASVSTSIVQSFTSSCEKHMIWTNIFYYSEAKHKGKHKYMYKTSNCFHSGQWM